MERISLIQTCQVNKDTNVSLNEKPRYVTIENAICFQETVKLNPQGSTSTGSLECSKITLEFSDSAGLLKSPIL